MRCGVVVLSVVDVQEGSADLVEVQLHLRRSTLLAIGFLGAAATADLATTAAGLLLGIPEANPIGAAALSTSAPIAALLAMKFVAGTIAMLPLTGTGYRRLRLAGPFLAATVWFAASSWNITAIVSTML